MNKSTLSPFYSHRLKYIGIINVVWGTVSFFLKDHQHHIYDLNLLCSMLSWGFCLIFFSREKVDDERIHMLKFRALAFGIPVGLIITHLMNYYFLNWEDPDSGGALQSISAFQSLAIILGLCLAVFYFQKFQEEHE